MSKLQLDLKEMPPVIAESVRIALAAHHIQLRMPNGRGLSSGELEALFNEIARNTAQALLAIDETDLNGGGGCEPSV